ncbi:MAG TPA: 50S ribosomal protein L4 [Anaerolineae bacterium]|nr:50S ribosomal protein L4 [Anaerolineae bacterium]
MKVPLRDMTGKVIDETELSDEIFGIAPNEAVMHQAMVRQRANARVASATTKTRGEVRGGGRKPWRQKGTGRARQGSIRAPQWRGGGVVFGPLAGRNYRKAMPRKMRRLALRSALSAKARDGQLILLDNLEMAAPKTKDMLSLLNALTGQSSALILLADKDPYVERSVNNLPHAKTLQARYLNLVDIFGHDYLVMPLAAVKVIEEFLGQ